MNSPDVIDLVHWNYDGTSRDGIAAATGGTFIPSSAYHGRVQQTTNAGIKLSTLTPSDTGIYSVEVLVMNGEGDVDLRTSSVFVFVTGTLARRQSLKQVSVAPHLSQLYVTGLTTDYCNRYCGSLLITVASTEARH